MSDTGSHRHSAPRPPRRRLPPLLVIAAIGLALVIGLGVALLVVRTRGGAGDAKDEMVTAGLPSPEPVPPPRPTVPSPTPTPARRGAGTAAAPAAAAEPPPDEVPVWERKPLRTDQPFPEEARFDPPTPPMKIPPEMLVPPAAPDAGAP